METQISLGTLICINTVGVLFGSKAEVMLAWLMPHTHTQTHREWCFSLL